MKQVWSIERKTLIGFTFSAVMLIGIQAIAFWGNIRTREGANLVSQTREVKENLEIFLSLLKDVQIGERGYLLSGETRFLAPYNNAITKINPQLDKVISLTIDNPSQQEAIAKLKLLVKQKLESTDRFLTDYQTQLKSLPQQPKSVSPDIKFNSEQLDRGKFLMDSIRGIILEMQNREDKLLTERIELENNIGQLFSSISYGVVGINFLVLVLIYQIISREINQRRSIESSLKQTKEQLEVVIGASNDGFWDWNLLTNEVYYSPRWMEMLGYEEYELPNTLETWNSLIYREDIPIDLDLSEDVINKYSAEDFTDGTDRLITTQKFRHKNGSIVSLLSRSTYLKDEQGQIIRMVGSHSDITEMTAMQSALVQSNLRLSSILNSSLDGIMVLKSIRDATGAIADFEFLLVNPIAYKIVKREPDSLIGKSLLVDMPGSRGSGLFDMYIHVVESGESVSKEIYYDHELIESWFQIGIVKVGDGFALTFRDIIAVKQFEQELQHTSQQLAARVELLNERNLEILRINELSDFLQACVSVNEAYGVIATMIEPLFPDCTGAILMIDNSRQRLEAVSSWGARQFSTNTFFPLECWALRRGRMHWVGEDRRDLLCTHVDKDYLPTESLCIPMIAQGETLGLLYLASTVPDRLTESRQQLARTVSEQIGMAIANLNLRETLRNQSIRDQLTGLFNRRYLEEFLTMEISRAERSNYTVGIIMLDVDHFKRFNDTMGHEAGDLVLNQLGKFLMAAIRTSDIACRYGGEELLLILPLANLDQTTQKAQEICEAIAKLRLNYKGKMIGSVTASLGVACYPIHGTTGNAVIQAADAALYRSKAAGRNQVMTAV